MKHKEAITVIRDLIDAGHDGALVPIQDGGKEVDTVWSHKSPKRVMGIEESERHMDRAIKAAWLALTGKVLEVADPVEFIYTGITGLKGVR